MWVAVIFVIAFLVAAFVIGVIVGNQNPPTRIDASNNTDGNCDANCAQLQQRRSETCTQKRQVAGLQAAVDSLGRQIAVATAIHVALVAAAVAAAFIPIVGPYIAVVIGGAAVAALATVTALFGEWVAKSSQLNQAKGFENTAMVNEAAARSLVLNTCSTEKANLCFNSLEVC
jgi:hypothetical protein